MYVFELEQIKDFDTFTKISPKRNEGLISGLVSIDPKSVFSKRVKDSTLQEYSNMKLFKGNKSYIIVMESIVGSNVFMFNNNEIEDITDILKNAFYY